MINVNLEGPNEYHLDNNLEDLETTLGETQEYWLLTIRAARTANELWENRHNFVSHYNLSPANAGTIGISLRGSSRWI